MSQTFKTFNYFVIAIEQDGKTMYIAYGKEYTRDGKRIKDLIPVQRHQDAFSYSSPSKDGVPGWQIALAEANKVAAGISPDLKPVVLRAQTRFEYATTEDRPSKSVGQFVLPVLQVPDHNNDAATSDAPVKMSLEEAAATVGKNVSKASSKAEKNKAEAAAVEA